MDFLKIFFRCIALVPGIVQGVETLYGSANGEKKKDAALSLVSSAARVTDVLAKKDIVDGAAFTAGLGAVIDGVVACLNASLWHKA